MNFSPVFGTGRAEPFIGKLVVDRVPDKIFVNGKTEHFLAQFHGPQFLAVL
jgi:hypothetical protein